MMHCTPVKFPSLPVDTQSSWMQKIHEVVGIRQLPQRDHPTQLLPFLYLGNYKHAKALSTMERVKVTHIINCAKASCPPTHNLYPTKSYLALDAEDTPTYPILAILWEEVYSFMEEARRAQGCLFIHCQAGVNRSATLAVAYCMVYNQWPLLKAIQHVFTLRPFILTNEFFQLQLVQFAHKYGLLG